MKKKIIYCLVMIVLLSSFLIVRGISYSSKVSNVEILFVEELDGKLTVVTNLNDKISNYQVFIHDEYNNLLYENISDTNRIDISKLMLDYEQEIYIKVVGYNEDIELSSEIFSYVNDRISFDESSENVILENHEIELDFLGNNDEYHLHLMHNNITIFKENIDDDTISIDYSVVDGYKGRVIAMIENSKNVVVDSHNLYIDPLLVDDVVILSPGDNDTFYYDDILVKYYGGENATSYKVYIYESNKLVGSVEGVNGKVLIPSSYFNPNTSYELELVAQYMDMAELSKTDRISLNIGEKLEVLPVTINYDYTNIDDGTLISLDTHTEDATIYYSVDGTNPIDGKIYESPILVNDGMVLKTVAYKKNYINSVISTYDISVGSDKPVIYLSPSNQYGNLGVKEVGYYNEMLITHEITDYLEDYLIDNGFIVYRNNPNADMSVWLNESRNVGSDLHLAIHTNGSTNHDVQGMEIFVHEELSPALSIARLMYDNLYDIYPYQSVYTDRGVKYAEGSLGEVNKANIKFGILIEIAFHDYYEDALWVVENKKKIAYNMGDTLISYYQMNEE